MAFYYKEYGLTHITDDRYFAVLGSIGSIMNGLARMFWGTMMDKVRFCVYWTLDLFQGHHLRFQRHFLPRLLFDLLRSRV